jgi:hypothetical protein
MDQRRNERANRCAPYTLAGLAGGDLTLPLLIPRRVTQRCQLGLFLGEQAHNRLARRFIQVGSQLSTVVIDVELSDDTTLAHGAFPSAFLDLQILPSHASKNQVTDFRQKRVEPPGLAHVALRLAQHPLPDLRHGVLVIGIRERMAVAIQGDSQARVTREGLHRLRRKPGVDSA